jgi:hypothetical protein
MNYTVYNMSHLTRSKPQDGIEAELFGNKATPDRPRCPNIPAIEATAYEIAAAMRYLHHHNILHGDLTAGNVLLTTVNPAPDNPRGFCAKVPPFPSPTLRVT